MKKEMPNYYSVIPAEVRYDHDLKANEKLLYGEITALSNKNGYCNASNAYFAELYGKHKDTISEWINRLVEKGYINTELVKNSLGRVEERRIFLSVKTPTPYRQKRLYPIGENTLGNITSINNNKEEEKENSAVDFYNNNIGMITPFIFEDMNSYLNERNRRKFDNRSNEKSSK